MSTLPLQLPTLQNWSCHNCGGCCRQHLIEITEEERQRILSQNWTAADGVPADRPLIEWFAGPPWRKRYRLTHRSDGSCVFLDERGLCRIHARFGEPAKPLACRIYPYAFHPHGKSIAVSLRFSCPSVVANLGRPVKQQLGDLQQLEALVVPAGAERMPPPRVSARERVDWPAFDVLLRQADQFLDHHDVPILLRVFRLLAFANLVNQMEFSGADVKQVREVTQLIGQMVLNEFSALPERIDAPSPMGRLYLRLFAAQYSRKDTAADLSSGWHGRWRLFRAVLRFARGTGNAPPLQQVFRPVPFAVLEEPHGGLPDGTGELMTRYFRVKIQGLHFCGPAFYDVPLVEGLQHLMLLTPVILWLSRWLARSADRTQIELADVQHALAMADHHHGYSPFLGQPSARQRLKYLSASGDLARLCAWYAR